MIKFISVLLISFSLLSFSSFGKKAAEQDKFASFRDKMEGVRFSGFFTMTGKDVPPMEETYEIQSVQKFGEEDLWIFTARVKYGKKDDRSTHASSREMGRRRSRHHHEGFEHPRSWHLQRPRGD